MARKSRIPSPATAEDILGARLRDLKKKQDELAIDIELGDTPCTCCPPTELTNPRSQDTGLPTIYAVEVLNELVYVLGSDTGTGYLKIYREAPDNSFVLVGSLVLSAVKQRMVLQGRYVYLMKGTASTLLTIDVGRPNDPRERSSVTIGTAAKNIANQGRWLYVAGPGVVKIVDISDPALPVIRGTAA